MAENNSSAPLKTAEGAVHPHLIALRTIAEYPATDSLMNMDAANMRRIAAQAVAAQAAPAAPDANRLRAEVLEHASKASRLVRTLFNEPAGTLSDVEVGDWIQRAQQYLSFATPALPATEDSSAGDQADGDFWPVDKNASRKQLIAQIGQMNFRLTALRQENAGLIKRAKAQAKVQAEPVAWPKDAADVRAFFSADFISAQFASDDHAPCDEDRYTISAHDFLSAVNWWADYPHIPRDADAAPQAQPADALDAEIAKLKKTCQELGNMFHDQIVAQQAAWIEWQHGAGAEAGMQWIENGLCGPGHIPHEDEPYGTEAQAYFDANKSDPFPACYCGRPSNILWMGKGFCSDSHHDEHRAAMAAAQEGGNAK